jgi:hypothetical protein
VPAPDAPAPEDPSPLLAAAAHDIAAALGLDRASRGALGATLPLLDDRAGRPLPGPPVPLPAGSAGDAPAPDPGDPGRLGLVHEGLLDAGHRHRRGVHYTPAAVADVLVGLVVDPLLGPSWDREQLPLICDPACGGGVFLLAAAEHLRRTGADPAAVLGALHGLDVDPLAVEVTRTALCLWAARAGVAGDALAAVAAGTADRIRVGDALEQPWPGEGCLAAVVGNPPFAGQLARGTTRDEQAARRARALLGEAAGYADTAGLFLVRALNAAPEGRLGLLQPLSFLGARDAGVVRRRLSEAADLEQVWLPGRVFGAAVDVCAPVLDVRGPLGTTPASGAPVSVRRGSEAEVVGAIPWARLRAAGSWSPIAALALGVPDVELADRGLLGERARPTAGFRDEFYGLAPFVVDLGSSTPGAPAEVPPLPSGHARLVTAGLVEPARTEWGTRATRVAGRRLSAPAVDLRALRLRADAVDGDRRLAAWADARLRPKVVVATQTPVVEAAVDEDGSWWPSVPVISVVPVVERPRVEELWMLAAALSAPPVTAWLAERTSGTALAARALRVTARLVAAVPLPVDDRQWSAGAEALRRVPDAGLDEQGQLLLTAGRHLTAAHGLVGRQASAVLTWWARRAGLAGPDAGGQAGVASGSRSGSRSG